MRRLRRMVRCQGGERHTIDRTGHGQLGLYLDVFGFRPQRESVGDGVRDLGGAYSQPQRESEHDRFGRQLDSDLVR
jgi:hypothetical protein